MDAPVGTVEGVTSDANAVLANQTNDSTFSNVIDELEWRGLIAVSTDREALRARFDAGPVTYYCGFDPTAASLHLGNLVQLLTMRRLQLAGNHPLALVGGATGLIGDPKPTAERTLNSKETVAEWVRSLQQQAARFLSVSGNNPVRLVNNLDWTGPMSAIDFLRDVGKFFRVGPMLTKDAVSTRLNSEIGISFTEFSYQVLQGMDFLELFRRYGCELETGGQDQWGNLTAGTDLIRKAEGAAVFAFGTPLIMNTDGTKFGKSEGNAVWLDAELTSPYAFYQFWLNTDDQDVVQRLKVFTFLHRDEIEALAVQVHDEPYKRAAQRRLAWEVTALVHSPEMADAVVAASAALFGGGDLSALPAEVVLSAVAELPRAEVVVGTPVARALVDAGLVKSLGEARRAITQGGVSVNNVHVSSVDALLTDFLADRVAVLRRGKKTLGAAWL